MTKPVRIGIIGVGYWGPNLVRNFNEIPECDLLWVCDARQERLDYVNEKWPSLRTTIKHEDVITDENVDAVVLATPIESHAGLARLILERGKHLFIEKPMTDRSDDAQQLVDSAKKQRLQIATGHIFVYHPAITAMKKILAEKRMGACYYGYSVRMNPAPSHGNVDVIWDLAVHDVSIALYLWNAMPVRVRASGSRFAHGARSDAANLELHFDDGTCVYHHVGWLTSARERTFFLACESGSMKFDDMAEDKLLVTGPAVDTRLDASAQRGHIFYAAGKIESVKLPPVEPLRAECEQFINAVKNNMPVTSDGRFGHAVVSVLEAASASIEQKGKFIELENVFQA